jgi:hypothetical protein
MEESVWSELLLPRCMGCKVTLGKISGGWW